MNSITWPYLQKQKKNNNKKTNEKEEKFGF